MTFPHCGSSGPEIADDAASMTKWGDCENFQDLFGRGIHDIIGVCIKSRVNPRRAAEYNQFTSN